MTGREKFRRLETILNIFALIFRIVPEFLCIFLWHMMLPFNGILVKGIRYSLLKSKAKKIGSNLSVGSNTIIKKWRNFSCGENVSIHENCMIDCDGVIDIGDNVSIAHSSSLVAANHTWDDSLIPIKYNPITKQGIVIKDDVWVGCGVRILDGVNIQHRVVVAAGAVVTRDVEKNSLVGGIPARFIKKI